EGPVGSDPEPQARELGVAEVGGDHPPGPLSQEGERIVAGGCNRDHRVAGPDPQGLDEDVGVLPDLGVTDLIETGPGLDLGTGAAHGAASRRSTRPEAPSRRIRSPDFSQRVASLSATTQGTPISRATMAEWESRLPRSAITPAALAKTAIQPGSVERAT